MNNDKINFFSLNIIAKLVLKYRKIYDERNIENEAMLKVLREENEKNKLQLNDHTKEINLLVKWYSA